MLKAETTATRAPRGTKPVSQAFFTALDSVPEAVRSAVARAAQIMIRDELKSRREKLKLAAAKAKARAPAAKTAKPAAKPAPAPVKAKAAPKPRKPRKADAHTAD